MEANRTLIDALLVAGVLVGSLSGLFYALYRVVVWARQRRKRAYVVGAALAPFIALGNVADPDFRIVQEAKRLKNREDDNPGDPPDPEEVLLFVPAPSTVATESSVGRQIETVAARTDRRRPALVWVLSIVLGLAATLTTLVLSWVLLVHPAPVGSMAPFEWASLYVMSALLLASMTTLFRLRKVSLRLFSVYLALGALASAWLAWFGEPRPYFDLEVTAFAGVPAAIAVYAYLHLLQKRRVLV